MCAEDAEVDAWLRTEVAVAAEALDADPTSGLSGDDVRAHFMAKRSAGE